MKERKEKRQKAFSLGHRAEFLASLTLMLKGYAIVERRYRTRLGEIDLIARRGNQVLIVEVKARRETASAMDAVDAKSIRRIEAASDLWLARQPDYARLSLRFDLIIVRPWSWPRHYPAFFTTQ
ncbi:YraN family protein [Brucellaceae bacterium C25G]